MPDAADEKVAERLQVIEQTVGKVQKSLALIEKQLTLIDRLLKEIS